MVFSGVSPVDRLPEGYRKRADTKHIEVENYVWRQLETTTSSLHFQRQPRGITARFYSRQRKLFLRHSLGKHCSIENDWERGQRGRQWYDSCSCRVIIGS